MRLLLDTCTFLWIISDDSELSQAARDAFQSPENAVFLSSLSVWEMAIKHSLGRLPMPEPPDRFIPSMRKAHGIDALPLDEQAPLLLTKLPDLHRDPFDRMLVCQALAGQMTLITPDDLIRQYPVQTLW